MLSQTRVSSQAIISNIPAFATLPSAIIIITSRIAPCIPPADQHPQGHATLPLSAQQLSSNVSADFFINHIKSQKQEVQ